SSWCCTSGGTFSTIAKLALSKLLPFNNNRRLKRTSGCSSHNGDNNSGDSHSNNFLRDSLNKLHSTEKPKDHHSKNGCKFNHHSSLPGHLRQEIITDLVDRSMRLSAIV